jgi:TonB family protein
LARDIRVTRQGRRFLNIHLETAEALEQIDEADFTHTRAIKASPRRIVVSSQVMQGNLINEVEPIYPENAKQNRLQGAVMLQVTIGEDGHVQDLRVISSPVKDFFSAAMDAVRQWTYKPFLLNGEAIQVQTTVNLMFNLGP